MVELLFRDELVDPDTGVGAMGDDGLLDAGVGDIETLGGVTTSLDSTGTILTIVHTAPLVANQFYTIDGNVRQSGAAAPTNLNTLGANGNGLIYTSDGSADGDLSTATDTNDVIEADNRSGNAGAGPAVPVLVFREAVAGTGVLVSTTTGTPPVTTQAADPTAGFTITPAGMTRLVSTNGDTIPTCFGCLGGDPGLAPPAAPVPVADTTTRVRAHFGAFGAIPGLPALSNGDTMTVDLNVVDVQGNRFTGRLTLTVD